MITIMRTAVCAAPGKRRDALAFANQVAKYLNEKYGGSVGAYAGWPGIWIGLRGD